MTVDLRTRTDGPDAEVDAQTALDHLLPEALGALAAPPPVVGRLDPLVLEVGDEVRTLRHTDGALSLVRGRAEAPTTWRLTPESFTQLIEDQVTPIGLLTAQRLDHDGRLAQILDWWLTMRAALDDQAWEDPADVATDLPALDRSFTLDDDPAELADFLRRAGFLHLRGVFEPDAMAQISRDMDAAAPTYLPGDRRGWWAKTVDGDRLVRMHGFDEHSATTRAMLEDPRWAAIGQIPGDGHRHDGLEGNRIEALFKPLGVIEGISDIPWHKDCSLGRHSYECCSLTLGVSVTGAGPGTGQLRVIPGSHRILVWPSLIDPDRIGLPNLPLATQTGDVTVHLSCTLHMAEPPTIRERRVMYTGFRLPRRSPEAEAAFHRLMRESRESAPLTTSQPSAV